MQRHTTPVEMEFSDEDEDVQFDDEVMEMFEEKLDEKLDALIKDVGIELRALIKELAPGMLQKEIAIWTGTKKDGETQEISCCPW